MRLGHQPKQKSSPPSSWNEGLVGCQKFRLAKERPCMIKDAKSVTGFGGQLRNVVSPKEIMAESETQEFE